MESNILLVWYKAKILNAERIFLSKFLNSFNKERKRDKIKNHEVR